MSDIERGREIMETINDSVERLVSVLGSKETEVRLRFEHLNIVLDGDVVALLSVRDHDGEEPAHKKEG